MSRPRTDQLDTPVTAKITREVTIAVLARDVELLIEEVKDLKTRKYVCYQEGEIKLLGGKQKWLSGILAAIAVVTLGSLGLVLTTCERQGEAQGRIEARVDIHSDRISRMENSVAEMNKARQEDTLRILEAIDGIKSEVDNGR